MNEKEALAILKEPNGSEKLAVKAEEAFEACLNLLAQEEPAAAAFLVRLARQKKYRDQINKWLGDRKLLYRLLGSDDAKMRKNIARLIGQLLIAADVLPLAEALEHESKRLVIPSMILALGAIKTPEAISVLHAYQVKPAQEAAEEKHVKAELEALKAALSAFQELSRHTFKEFSSKMPLELRCGRGLERALAEELAELDVRDVTPGRVTLALDRWERLKVSRIWREALIPLSRGVEVSTDTAQAVKDSAVAIAAAAGHKMLAILKDVYGGETPYAFRVELAGQSELTKAVARALETVEGGRSLVNAPSNYEAELRVQLYAAKPQTAKKGAAEHSTQQAALYLKLYLTPDRRFAYRKGAVPASIHPANAAGVIRLAKPYLKEGATVLDPCCGSGTLLWERGIYGPCRSLTGVDLQKSALQVAAENYKAVRAGGMQGAKVACKLICSDFLKYRPEQPVDELFANLPFGNRVGSHEENLRLYKGLAQRIPQWVKPGGIAVLYTMEGKLLEQCIYGQSRLKILKQHKVEAGGLEPKVLVVRVL